MRIVMISDVYFPRINGVSTSIETFRRDLQDCDVHVTLVAPEYPERHDVPNTHRVPSRRLPFDPEDRLMRWNRLVHTTRRLAEEKFAVVAGFRPVPGYGYNPPFIEPERWAGFQA